MNVVHVLEITNRGFVLITDEKVPEIDWISSRTAKRIHVFNTEHSAIFEVEEVMLTLKNGSDYLSYRIKEELDEKLIESLKDRKVERS
ncbi:hypothetical protein MLD52_21630 [Puniceicoccaceae bacterium K14]|nr:hypothetical protein [Puniceicoccaceae bacterium K14]